MKFYCLLVVSLLFLQGCATSGNPPVTLTSVSNESNENLYDLYMAEERQWAGLTSKKIQVREGLALAYSEGGDLNAPVLVLLHGYYGDRNNWNRVVNQLQNKYRIIIPDMPGHGDSDPHPDANYSFAEMSFVLNDMMQQLGVEHFHLAGHSMGGAIAVQWTMSNSSKIDSLILVDSAGKYRNNKSEIMQQMLAGENPMRIAERGDAARVLAFAMAAPPFVPKKVMYDFETKQLQRTAIYDKVMADMLARDKTLNVRFFYTALKLFDKPALVIWGSEDAIFTVDVASELAESLPHANLVVVEGAGHTPLLEAPWPTSSAMRAFLGRL